jgi:hypothetical protein
MLGTVAKFIAALLTGLVSWTTVVVTSPDPDITTTEWIMLVGVLATAFLVWVVPNQGRTYPS